MTEASRYVMPGIQSAPERTGWRDEWISTWHRNQHHSLAMTDLDFVCAESAFNTPVAIIDYKKMRKMHLSHPSGALKSINNLSLMARLPFFIVFYQEEPPVFTVEPMNPQAHDWMPSGTEVMSEREYVEFLFAIRKQQPDEAYLQTLSTMKPLRKAS